MNYADYVDRLEHLQFHHRVIGTSYVILGLGFVALLFLALLTIRRDRRSPERRWRDSHPDRWYHRMFCTVLAVLTKALPGIVAMGSLGATAFLVGCGWHHFFQASEVIPDAFRQGDLDMDVFVGPNFRTHQLIEHFQSYGAPAMLLSGLLVGILFTAQQITRIREK